MSARAIATVFVLIVAVDVGVFAFRKQGVAVKGRLTCGDKPLKNTKVKIFDVDRNPGDSDDMLDEKFTDANGEFSLDGTTRELTQIEPELRIFHDCNDGIRPCQRRVVIEVPTKYIHHGTVKEWYNIGTLNVKQPFPNEDRSCDFI
uniref:Transthyretin-like family protein n=1 Tax=Steinernema glaseri TaxID=37863 RepID=A0A1I7ZD17_9BILA